jgi:hypothetical protein
MGGQRLFVFEVGDDTSVFAITGTESKALVACQATDPLTYFDVAASIAKTTQLRPCAADGSEITDNSFAPNDYGVWGTCAAFSESAFELLCAYGASRDEFCRVPIATNRSAVAYIFTPRLLRDFLEAESIISKHLIPTRPAMPFWITRAKVREDIKELPPIFVNLSPEKSAWLSELFATELLVNEWNKRGLSGALFRAL